MRHTADGRGVAVRVLLVGVVVVWGLSGCGGTSTSAVTLTAPAEPSSPSPTAVSLPSDGWKVGDPVMQALTAGVFHAVRTGDHACAWLGDTRRPFDWPEAWRVTFDPTPRLLDANGAEMAREGQRVFLGGGGSYAGQAGRCWSKGEWVSHVNGVDHVIR
jgi:hypothetical protein